MSKLRRPPTVYQASHIQRSGLKMVDKLYSFRVQYNGKRKTIKTDFKNKRKAQEYVNSIYSSETKFSDFLKEQFEDKAALEEKIRVESTISNEKLSVIEALKQHGWMNWETNPKRISQQKEGKNYGSRHAKNLAFNLNHLFVETDKYDWFSNKEILSIKREDAQKLSNQLYQDRTVRGTVCEEDIELKDSIGNYKVNIIALKSFFTFCFDNLGIIETNPFQRIRIPKSKQIQKKAFFAQSQLRAMFDREFLENIEFDDIKNKKKWISFLDSAYFKSYFFTALTGLRSGEVRALKWTQISEDIVVLINRAFKENTIQEKDVDTPKWGKVRTIILCDSAYRIIRENGDHDHGSYVFSNKLGNALDASSWNKNFKFFISVLLGNLLFSSDPYTPHSFRGSLNSLLVKEGNVSESLIRKYLGWTANNPLSEVQEKYYTRFSNEDMLKIAEGIELVFSGKKLQHEYISEEEKHELASFNYATNKFQ